MTAWYNENDPFAAAWLRELIRKGLIADGDVDERDIRDVRAIDLIGYDQHHFFAGIGVWSYALRRAGWPDDKPVWTGSCPCQPFSAAGKGGGFDDERHLWPSWFWLVEQCRPAVVLGEQVASKDGLGWLDLVQADMEAADYAFGAVDTCSAGVGAPHIRQRLYWVADAGDERREGQHSLLQPGRSRQAGAETAGGRRPDGLADALRGRTHDGPGAGLGAQAAPDGEDRDLPWQRLRPWLQGQPGGLADADDARSQGRRQPGRERAAERPAGAGGVAGGLADASSSRGRAGLRDSGSREERRLLVADNGGDGGLADADRGQCIGIADGEGCFRDGQAAGWQQGDSEFEPCDDLGGSGPVNGIWRDADWLYCRDGKWRPVEPGTFPLAHGAAARVGRLRGYGNALNAEAATAFITAYATSCL